MPEPLLYETHMHTPLCKHADGLPGEYAAVAEQRGLKGIIVTCHNPLPGGMCPSVRMAPDEWNEYLDMVQAAREQWQGRVDVRVGLECDYLPGLDSFLEEQIGSTQLHHVLGSIHPFIQEYRQLFWTGNVREYFITYFENVAKAAESRLFDTISHPDLVKNMAPADWDVRSVMDEIKRRLDRIAAIGVAMELNTSGVNKPYSEYNPGMEILREMREREIPCVIGADAHVPDRVADGYIDALQTLREAGYEHVSYFIDRKRQDVLIEDAIGSLKPVQA